MPVSGERQAPPRYLEQQPRRLGGTQHRHAVHVGGVEAGGEHRDVAEVLERRPGRPEEVGGDVLPLEAGDDLVALPGGRVARHHGALLARVLGYLLGHVAAVLHAGAEDDDGLALLRQDGDFRAGRPDQLLAVHRGGQFVLDEFARPYVDGRKVGLGAPGAGHDGREVALRYHVLEPRLVADFVEQVPGLADGAALQAERRRGQPDEAYVRVDDLHVVEEGAVHSLAVGCYEVAVVNQDSVSVVRRVSFDLQIVHSARAFEFDMCNTDHPDSASQRLVFLSASLVFFAECEFPSN